jgi:hypothetical protein
MKTKLLLFFTIISANAFSQSVFPESDAIWNVLSSYYYLGNLYYGLKGDTVIEEKTYQKLYLLDSPNLSNIRDEFYFGAFYQADKKVWFRTKMENGNEEDFLLYDFSKNVGDTIHHGYFKIEHAYSFVPNEYEWITIINNIEENQGTKIFFVTSGYYYKFDFGGEDWEMNDVQWIEGIGGDYGLFYTIFEIPLCDCPAENRVLACLKENEVVKYLNTDYCSDCFSCSKLDVGIPVIFNEKDKLNIFSNGKDMLILKAKSTILSVSIVDSSGKEILHRKWPDIEQERDLNINSLPQGVYTVKATLGDKSTLVNKWIKW